MLPCLPTCAQLHVSIITQFRNPCLGNDTTLGGLGLPASIYLRQPSTDQSNANSL